MTEACNITSMTLDHITPYVKQGVTTLDLNDIAHDFMVKMSARPAPLGYKGYPKSVCTSINHVVCHGIPSSDVVLKNSDILNIDVSLEYDGHYGDSSRMFYIGNPSPKAAKLVNATYQAMHKGISAAIIGNTIGDIGHAIQSYAENMGFSVVRDFVGHGIGLDLHEDPIVYHYGKPNTGVTLKEGMCFTIEPMINVGGYAVKILNDGWTAVTRDRSLSAQFEHVVYIEKCGPRILTLSKKGYEKPPYY